MSSRVTPPASARLIRSESFRIPEGYTYAAVAGGRVEIGLWEGEASDGFKTDYTRRPARWTTGESWTRERKHYDRHGKRWSGAQIGNAEQWYEETRRHLVSLGAVSEKVELASVRRYQKPKNANGSTARHFYELTQRRAKP